eukprot:COSAG06_NODE_60743_length_270_cov_0.567251_1_plen_25_part_01
MYFLFMGGDFAPLTRLGAHAGMLGL